MSDPADHIFSEFLLSDGVSTDSREELENRIFIALKGDFFDGNLFVEQALEKGCRLALTNRKDLQGTPRVVNVPSGLAALQELALHHRRKLKVKLLAITGSNGKTTSKELLAAVLGQKFKVKATRGNLNNHIGVPQTLLSLTGDEEIAIIEMGANHPGEIATLSAIANPNLGIITNVGKAHLEGFGSVEGVLKAKGELYDHLSRNGGVALVDGEDRMLMLKARESGAELRVIGENADLRVKGKIISQKPALEVELSLNGIAHRFQTQLVGDYNLQNIRLAAAGGLYFGVPGDRIASALASYVPLNYRSQLVEGTNNRLIMDAYNANPTSMRRAVEALMEYAKGPVMLILGDMAELGKEAAKEHLELANWLQSLDPGPILLAGEHFSRQVENSEKIQVFRDTAALEEYIQSNRPQGFHILLKGSRVMGLERLMSLLK